MKYYIVTPAHKKSVYETECFEDESGNRVLATTCWRAATFKVSVPETLEEHRDAGYDEDDMGTWLWPNEDDDYVEMDDFFEFEMIDTWDGCSEEYDFKFEDDAYRDQVEEILNEDGMFALFDSEKIDGFQPVNCWYEIHGGIVLEECDENGNIL